MLYVTRIVIESLSESDAKVLFDEGAFGNTNWCKFSFSISGRVRGISDTFTIHSVGDLAVVLDLIEFYTDVLVLDDLAEVVVRSSWLAGSMSEDRVRADVYSFIRDSCEYSDCLEIRYDESIRGNAVMMVCGSALTFIPACIE